MALLSDASRGLGARLGKIIKHVIALDAYVWLNYEYMYGGGEIHNIMQIHNNFLWTDNILHNIPHI